jgi:hypothetical protein
LSRKIESPAGSDHLLEVLIVNHHMNKVLWDGETIYNPQDRSDQDWMKGLPDITGEGVLGVFSRLGDTVFSDARFLITRQPSLKKDLEP